MVYDEKKGEKLEKRKDFILTANGGMRVRRVEKVGSLF